MEGPSGSQDTTEHERELSEKKRDGEGGEKGEHARERTDLSFSLPRSKLTEKIPFA